jgi:hypothetical protein
MGRRQEKDKKSIKVSRVNQLLEIDAFLFPPQSNGGLAVEYRKRLVELVRAQVRKLET